MTVTMPPGTHRHSQIDLEKRQRMESDFQQKLALFLRKQEAFRQLQRDFQQQRAYFSQRRQELAWEREELDRSIQEQKLNAYRRRVVY